MNPRGRRIEDARWKSIQCFNMLRTMSDAIETDGMMGWEIENVVPERHRGEGVDYTQLRSSVEYRIDPVSGLIGFDFTIKQAIGGVSTFSRTCKW